MSQSVQLVGLCRQLHTGVCLLAYLDKVVIRAGDDVAPGAVQSNAIHCKVVPAQGALMPQLLHILARRQQAPGLMRCCGPSCT